MQTWQKKQLGEICEIYQPKTISQKEMTVNGIFPVFGANGIIGRYNKYNHEKSEILLGCRGSCGLVNISEPKSWINGNAMIIRPKNEDLIKKSFIFYFLKMNDFSKIITGAAIPQITRKTLYPLEIFIPSPDEQNRIVKILDKTFAKLEKVKENTEKNLQNSKELFESYLNNIFSNPEKDWEEKTLKEILKLEYGKPLPDSKRKINGKYPIYGANGEKGATDEFYYNKLSIIVGRKGTAGALNLTKEKFWPLDVTYFVTFDNLKYNLIFIYYLLLTLNLTKLAKGVKPGINRNEVYSIVVNIPKSLQEQKQIVDNLNKLSEKTKKLEEIYNKKLENLEELKKSILHKAFNGEL